MDVRNEVRKIIKRNKRVEADKAWETSFARKFTVFVMTYLIVVLFLWIAKIPNPWFNSLIPSIAFIISTMTLPLFKKWWIKKIYKK